MRYEEIISEDLKKLSEAIEGSNFEGKNILVTGGAGFLGSWICDVLLSFGASVTVVDDFSTGRKENLSRAMGNSNFRLFEADVRSFDCGERFDFIFHLAAHASPDDYQKNPVRTLEASSFGTAMMAELARKSDAVLLFSSTSEVYGDAKLVPTPESYWGYVNPIGPRSCYDEGKRFGEAFLVAYGRQYGLDARICRIFNTYGPRLREDGLYGRVVSRFVLQGLSGLPLTVYGTGSQTRSFCYVTDTVTGLLRLMVAAGAKGEVVNVGNTEERSILEVANLVREFTGCRSELQFSPLPVDDPRRRQPDILKLKRLTGWSPKVSFVEGLKRTIEWFSSAK